MKVLSKNLAWLRKQKGWSQKEVSDILKVGRSAYANWESGQAVPPVEKLLKVLNLYSVSFEDITGINMSTKRISLNNEKALLSTGKDDTTSEPKSVHLLGELVHPIRHRSNKNLFVPVKAQASYTAGWADEYLEEQVQYVNVPGIEQEARTFEVEGNSMWPTIHHGDYVVCTRIETFQQIKEGIVYIIISSQSGVLAKCVRLHSDRLELLSANSIEYRPFSMPLDEVREIWQARMKISKHFDPGQPIVQSGQLLTRIEHLETFISKIFPDFDQDQE